ncbi:hypothetical protein FIU83_08145 [Halomonas sp. THAF5a]|nr:hypothetical protein FIU83_08145 [Halomonas sp. THAF5a]
MPEITLMPVPQGRWVLMCPCGATEIRAQDGPHWAAFDLEKVDGRRYRITCQACGHITEHHWNQDAMGSIRSASS